MIFYRVFKTLESKYLEDMVFRKSLTYNEIQNILDKNDIYAEHKVFSFHLRNIKKEKIKTPRNIIE